MDRLFLDANILFSAAYGSPGIRRFWELQKAGKCQLVVSGYVVEEARRNLDSPEQLVRLEELMAELERVPEPPVGTNCPIELPDKDRPVFIAALAARATHLITGDTRHFGDFFGREVHGVRLFTPAEYLR